MIKAKFIGNADNASYQCDEFNARIGDTVAMPNIRWATIAADGQAELFTKLDENEAEFPTQRTIG